MCIRFSFMCMICSGFAQEPSAPQPRFEVFGGLSVNADYIQNRAALLIADEKVSPYFSLGSGPTGFEASFKRYVWKGLGVKGDLSSYSDAFPKGKATYCQPDSSVTGIACGTGLSFKATSRTYYVTAGPEWKIQRDKRFAPFAQVLAGIVHASSNFEMAGSDVQYTNPFTGGLLLYTSAGFPKDRNVRYSDSHADTGLALSIGGGLDTRLTKRLSFRVAMDYDPTFLVRPVVYDPVPDAQGRVSLPTPRSERRRQDHVRLSLGIVWRIR
jgi:opacity protein-like surface antigen